MLTPGDERASGHRGRGPCRARVGAADVRRLLTACTSPRERAFVRLLASVALRIGAVAGLRWADVWDDPGAAIRTRWEVLEKLGHIRVVVPRESLRRALEDWRTAAMRRGPRPVYVFEARAGRRPTERGLHKLLQRLCRRAGLPRPIPPHAFRRYVVGEGIRRGASLAEMSRFLGHRGVSTTMRYYWTEDDAGAAMIHTLDAPPAAPTDAVAPDVRGPGRRTADPDSLDGLIDALLFGGP